MEGLTEKIPKPLLEVAGKSLLQHKFDILPDEANEIVLVVGYFGDMIRNRFGDSYKGRKIIYAEQGPKHGTAGALWSARQILRDRFVVMMGDDLYGKSDVERACKSGTWLMFAMELPHIQGGGKIIESEGKIADIIESDEHGESGLVSTNLFSLDMRLFEYEMAPKRENSEEYGLPQTVLAASKASGISLKLVKTEAWIQITAPEDLKKAQEMLKNVKN